MQPHILKVIRGFATDGPNRLVLSLLRALSVAEARVSILALDEDGPLRREFVAETGRLWGGVYTPHGTRDLPWPALFRSVGVNVVHAHLPRAEFFGRRLAKAMNVPYFSTEHGIHAWGEKFLPARPLVAAWYRRTLPSDATIVAISAKVRRELLHAGIPAERIATVPNGIAVDNFPPVDAERRSAARRALEIPETGNPVVLVLGALNKRKRPMLALDAFRELHKVMPEAHLVFVGSGPQRETIAGSAFWMKLHRSVSFPGQRRNPADALAASDILLHTSVNEPFGLAVAEALAQGLPVVARAGSGADALLPTSNCVAAVEGDSPACWAGALQGSLEAWRSDPVAPKRLRDHAREAFSISRTAGDYLGLWLAAIDRREKEVA